MKRKIKLLEGKKKLMEANGSFLYEEGKVLGSIPYEGIIDRLGAFRGYEDGGIYLRRYHLPEGVRDFQVDISYDGRGPVVSYNGKPIKQDDVFVTMGELRKGNAMTLKKGSNLGYYKWITGGQNKFEYLNPQGGRYLYILDSNTEW